MSLLDAQCRAALEDPPDQQAIEFSGRWFSWGDVRAVADEVAGLLAIAELGENAAIAFVPRNRPSAVAAELGMIGAHMRQHLYATHIPTAWRFVDAMPHNRPMKVDRAGVAALFAQ